MSEQNSAEPLERKDVKSSGSLEFLKSLDGTPPHLGLFLGGLALCVGALLAFSDASTHDVIRLRAEEDLQASLGQVIPKQYYDASPSANILSVKDNELGDTVVYRAGKASAISAVAYQVVGKGYGGDIVILMGVARDGAILGVRILSHAETPGLGDKIEASKSDWVFSFNGRSLEDPTRDRWNIKKDGGVFDQFTGASITPRAVVRAVTQGLEFFNRHRSALLAPIAKGAS